MTKPKKAARRRDRHVSVRGVRREQVDSHKLSRALLALAQAQAEADAEAQNTASKAPRQRGAQ